MTLLVDEVSVLRDAHWLGAQNADLCPVVGTPDYDIAKRLCDAGYLEISVVGRIVGEGCYRLTPKGTPLAALCRSVVDAEREGLLGRVAAALAGVSR